MTIECFVAVHIGAGSHSISRTGMYREICERVCTQTMELLRNGCEARKAVAYALSLLEVFIIYF
jgi:isoaspartyl peptidase/L-asparaginase-like protein (Ntn-hydrolase superfamily)